MEREITICDRCGIEMNRYYHKSFLKKIQKTGLSFEYTGYFSRIPDKIDLCPSCIMSFKEWLYNDAIEEEQHD